MGDKIGQQQTKGTQIQVSQYYNIIKILQYFGTEQKQNNSIGVPNIAIYCNNCICAILMYCVVDCCRLVAQQQKATCSDSDSGTHSAQSESVKFLEIPVKL